MKAHKLFAVAVVAAAMSVVACGRNSGSDKTKGVTDLKKPGSTNPHNSAECPAMIDGEWLTEDGQKFTVAHDDKKQVTFTMAVDGVARPVDGEVHKVNEGRIVEFTAYCSKNQLVYSHKLGSGGEIDREETAVITVDNVLTGKLDRTKKYLARNGKVLNEKKEQFALGRPAAVLSNKEIQDAMNLPPVEIPAPIDPQQFM